MRDLRLDDVSQRQEKLQSLTEKEGIGFEILPDSLVWLGFCIWASI